MPSADVLRSLLYVSEDQPAVFAKAVSAGLDALILSLEGAVDPTRRAAAREYRGEWSRREQVWRSAGLRRINCLLPEHRSAATLSSALGWTRSCLKGLLNRPTPSVSTTSRPTSRTCAAWTGVLRLS